MTLSRPSQAPTGEYFRATGYTAAAADYPLSEAAVRWLCKFNNVDPEKWSVPDTWWYAPNEYMRAYLERNASK